MRRRDFLRIMGAAAGWPSAAAAQQDASRHVPIVGFTGFATLEADAPALQHFRKGLADLGYIEGRNIIIDARSTGGDIAGGSR
jgi:putative ABC transport system substrate-binding protein